MWGCTCVKSIATDFILFVLMLCCYNTVVEGWVLTNLFNQTNFYMPVSSQKPVVPRLSFVHVCHFFFHKTIWLGCWFSCLNCFTFSMSVISEPTLWFIYFSLLKAFIRVIECMCFSLQQVRMNNSTFCLSSTIFSTSESNVSASPCNCCTLICLCSNCWLRSVWWSLSSFISPSQELASWERKNSFQNTPIRILHVKCLKIKCKCHLNHFSLRKMLKYKTKESYRNLLLEIINKIST